jgi:hypothetical protein
MIVFWTGSCLELKNHSFVNVVCAAAGSSDKRLAGFLLTLSVQQVVAIKGWLASC